MDDGSEARMGGEHEECDSGHEFKVKWLTESDEPMEH